ncbi:MAG: hypothetical protein IJX05_02940 [Clostridia bacterium]|nr:hypothetical protein [Clostridia bacterium]
MTDEAKYTLSPKKRFICNLIAAIGILTCGAVLLVFGIIGNGVGVYVSQLIVPVILLTIGLIFMITSLIQMNTVTFYLAIVFLVCSLVSFLAHFTPLSYGMIYPLYIASPAIASLFTMIMSKEYAFHLRLIFLFAVPAVFFQLFATELWSLSVLVPVLLMYCGLVVLSFALSANSVSEE